MGDYVRKISKIFMLSAITLLLGAINSAWADDLISCRYISSQGKNILLVLDVASPVPHMVIVIQKIPYGTTITHADPGFKKFDQARREVKWMLTGLKPGNMQMAMTLDRAARKGEVTGEIRYKNPVTGHMVKMAISP